MVPSRPERVRRTALACVAALALTAAAPHASAVDAAVPVTSESAAFWSGTAAVSDQTFEDVPACRTTGCDHIRIDVALPAELRSGPGGVQVAIRWQDLSTSLGLHAVRNGRVVASSTGQIGTAQSLLLPKGNASYDVYVSHQPLDPSVAATTVAYEGLAEYEAEPEVAPRRELLPDLRILPQRFITFASPSPIFEDSVPAGSTCFTSEIVEQGARTCLRFGQAAENRGEGALDVRYSVDPADPGGEVEAAQRIYRSDGTYRDRSAGFMHYHPAHLHHHFEGFSQSWLYPIGEDGSAGPVPAASGRKNGFCMADTEMARWGLKGDSPQTYPAPRCLEPIGHRHGRDLFKNGISAGWADEYAWNLPDQMIEVSGLTDGRYRLVTRVDADDRLVEADESNNCIALDVELTGLGAQPSATVVGDPIPCT
jgi:hypothetical protein